jgi:hypothetical protein
VVDRIRCPPGITEARRDVALEGFRKIGHMWFLRGLVQDCVSYIRTLHGTSWLKPRHAKDGELTTLGKDKHIVALGEHELVRLSRGIYTGSLLVLHQVSENGPRRCGSFL